MTFANRPTTIYADASLCPDTGAAGYGCWIKSDIGQFEYGGVMYTPVLHSDQAEWLAMANAVAIASTKMLIIEGGTLVLTSDSMNVVGKAAALARPVAELALRAWHTIQDHATLHHCRIITRHVKGHSRRDGARSYCNARCDYLAREAMRARREELRAAGIHDGWSHTLPQDAASILQRRRAKEAERAARRVAPFPWEEK